MKWDKLTVMSQEAFHLAQSEGKYGEGDTVRIDVNEKKNFIFS